MGSSNFKAIHVQIHKPCTSQNTFSGGQAHPKSRGKQINEEKKVWASNHDLSRLVQAYSVPKSQWRQRQWLRCMWDRVFQMVKFLKHNISFKHSFSLSALLHPYCISTPYNKNVLLYKPVKSRVPGYSLNVAARSVSNWLYSIDKRV